MLPEASERSGRASGLRLRDHEAFVGLPQLSDKAIVDLVNDLRVTRDHAGEQSRRQSRVLRFLDIVTGKGARRQHAINASQVEQTHAVVLHLKELDVVASTCMMTIKHVADNIGALADRSLEYGNAIVGLEDDLRLLGATANRRFEDLSAELDRVDKEQKAQRHLTTEIARWEACRLAMHSPMERLFLVLDALYWGAFGDCLRAPGQECSASAWLEQLRNTVAKVLMGELDVNSTRPIPLERWLATPGTCPPAIEAGIRYLAEPSNDHQPLSHMVASAPDHAMTPRVPRIVSIDRAINRMIEEVFVRRLLA